MERVRAQGLGQDGCVQVVCEAVWSASGGVQSPGGSPDSIGHLGLYAGLGEALQSTWSVPWRAVASPV